jgi:hypothetical protein
MRCTFEPLPSPLMGEGAGGGEDGTSSPHATLPPHRGEAVLTYPCQPSMGEGWWGSGQRAVPPSQPYPAKERRGIDLSLSAPGGAR